MNTMCLNKTDRAEAGVGTRSVTLAGLLTAALLVLSSVIAPKAMALEVPDFEQLVKDQGSAVVKISVTGKVQESRPQFQGQELPEPLRRYFENLPRQQTPQNRPTAGFGSGFIISEDGYIVTNAHVVDGAAEITVSLPDRREYAAQLMGSDERSDIALLKVDARGLPVLTLGDSSGVNVGQWVLAIGSPFGFEYTATQGIVSAVSRSLPAENYVPFIQTDVAVNPGNSGGPLFDTNGQVIGVNSQIYSRSGGYQGLSFAIPVNVVKSVVAQLQDNGYVKRGWLGVLIQNVDRSLAESFGLDRSAGALVSRVTENSPAQAAGVQRGDVILSFNGTEINRSSDLPPLVGLIPVGDAVNVDLLRKGERLTLSVNIAELEDGDRKPAAVKTSAKERMSGSRLGLSIVELNAEQRDQLGTDGVLVEEVDPDGVAAAAGIRTGDVLVSFNQTDVSSVHQLSQLVKDAPAGKPLAVLVQRDDSSLFSALTLN